MKRKKIDFTDILKKNHFGRKIMILWKCEEYSHLITENFDVTIKI